MKSNQILELKSPGSIVLFLALFLFLLPSVKVSSAPKQDTKGTDFWLAYPPNFHNNINSMYEALRKGDSLYIIISAEEPTKGIIEYKDKKGQEYSQEFSIDEANGTYIFKVTHYDFEVTGFNESGNILSLNDPDNQSEVVAKNTFHITTDKEVTLVAHSQAVTTSESFLVLPRDVLGYEYLVMAYNSHGSMDPWDVALSSQSTPSQFLIVSTEDSTKINIKSDTEFYRNDKNPINITLNKGEVFLVQAKITITNDRADLTGTEIDSDKPIAVFSGHQRTIIPIYESSLISRDCLMEQLLPIRAWGKNATIIPFDTAKNAIAVGDDIFRVLFSEDQTDFYINGYYEGRFNRGEYYEQAINGPLFLEARNAILVAQYKKTSQGSGQGSQPESDPFMSIAQSKEHFLKEYSVNCLQTYEMGTSYGEPTDQYGKVYNDYYLGIITDSNYISTLFIDDTLVDAGIFKQIGPSQYKYANIKMSEGKHFVKSDEPFGLSVYAYGYANGYGYPAGFNFEGFIFDVEEKGILNSNILTNTPNPAENRTTIEINLDEETDLQIEVYNVLGETIIKNDLGHYSAGKQQIILNTKDFESGTYYYILRTNKRVYSGKLIKL